MFRAYVEEDADPNLPAPADNRNLIIGLVVAIVVLALLLVFLVA